MRAPTLMDKPVLFPGRCMTCGRSNCPVVDTMIDADDGGRVYLCADVCVPSFARLASMVPQTQLDEVRNMLAAANDVILDLEGQLAELQPVRDALEAAAERFGSLDANDEPVTPRAPRRKAA